MLKKLLRYDLAPIFKYWWIAALTSFVVSLLGGGCITILRADPKPPVILTAIAGAGLVLIVFCNIAFVILAEILSYLRYYRNFYTDEGYLTFTLPVKTTTLIASKLIMVSITMVATGLILMLNIFSMVALGFGGDFWNEITTILSELWAQLGLYLPLYAFLAILLILVLCVFSSLLVFCCITIAAILAKKAKVFCAIALMYAVSGVTSAIFQLFSYLSMFGAFDWLERLPESSVKPFIALFLVGLIAFIATLSAAAYLAQYRMIDRKLNLA